MTNTKKHSLLRLLPGVDVLLKLIKDDKDFSQIPDTVRKASIRKALGQIRTRILSNDDQEFPREKILSTVLANAKKTMAPRLVPLINATGVVLHTNLGRALLCDDALDNIRTIGSNLSNLEFDIKTGKRGIRYSAVEDLICELTTAPAAMAVNNNAGAVLLCLNTLARHKEVVVSRGELIEIGGSFRIPDVMVKSGCILKEVGTTNRTHLRDYEDAVSSETGLLLKVHTSNYKIEGFTKNVSLQELVTIGVENNIPVMEDLGSGSLIDLSKYGLAKEPTVSDAVQSGADLVTFSGDKLLGGPQAGIIVGKKSAIEQIRANPLTRTLRIDKLTLAALESTLKLYRDENKAIKKIPTLRMLTEPFDSIAKRANLILTDLKKQVGSNAIIDHADLSSQTGGGAYPGLSLPSRCITIKPALLSASALEKRLRMCTPSIITRIEDNRVIIDPRTVQKGEEIIISDALASILTENSK